MMRKISVMLAVILMMSAVLSSVTLAFELPLRVVVNKEKVEFSDAEPFEDDQGRIQVPLRFVSEALGAKVGWDHETGKATVELDKKVIVFTIDKEEYTINGENKKMDTKALLKDTRTFVPVRYVSEGLGATVEWDESINTVYIDTTTIAAEAEIDRSKPWKEEYYGFTVTHNTGSKLSTRKGSYEEDPTYSVLMLTINFDTNDANYDMQVKEVEEILKQQVDKNTVDELIKFVKRKTAKDQELGFKEFIDDTYNIAVLSKQNKNIGITVYYK
jgi:Copper amine oxidase N-terminal domain